MKVSRKIDTYAGVINSILIASAAALLLYLARSIATGTAQFSFMAWNLALSLVALVTAVSFVVYRQKSSKYLSWVFFVLWVFLLPNTFYMLTDFVHVRESGDINMLFDIVLVGLFAMNGFVHGLLSIFIVHKTLIKRFQKIYVHASIVIIMLSSSFAVDMGRYLRWNSWDVLINPRALLFDVSDTFLNPANYDRSFLITGVFFVAISSLYLLVWEGSRLFDKKHILS